MPVSNLEQILFDNVRNASELSPDSTAASRYLHNDPKLVLPYLPEGASIQIAGDSSNDESRMESACQALVQKLLFIVEQLPHGVQDVDFMEEALRGDNPIAMEEAVGVLKRYADNHPDTAEQYPLLKLMASLPRGTGFYLKAFYHSRPTRQKKNIPSKEEKYALDNNIPFTMLNSRYYYGMPITNEVAIHLALGSLYPADYLITYEHGGKLDHNKTNLDVPTIVSTYKAARAVYGKAWQEQNPARLAATTRHIANLEWQSTVANPLWKNKQEQNFFIGLKDRKNLLRYVAAIDQGGNVELSWQFFLMKLWENETLLFEQFKNIQRIDDVDLQDVRTHLNDPRLEDALFSIGKEMEIGGKIGFAFSGKDVPELVREDLIRMVRQAIAEHGFPYKRNFYKIEELIVALRPIQWETYIMPFKKMLTEKVSDPNLFAEAAQFEEGFFRDFFLHEAWKQEPVKTRERADEYLRLMRREIPDGAKANRAPDLMSQYVRNNFTQGTFHDERFQLEYLNQHRSNFSWRENFGSMSPETIAELTDEETGITLGQLKNNIYNYDGDVFIEPHLARKEKFRSEVKALEAPPSHQIYIFSDAIKREPKQEAILDQSFKYKLVAEFMNEQVDDLASKIEAGYGLSFASIGVAREWLTSQVAEPCLFRDFYTENLLNVAVWGFLQQSHIAGRLSVEGIKFKSTVIDLHNHFDGKDTGILADAYMTRYPILRVEGLAGRIQLLTGAERTALARLIRGWSTLMSPQSAEGYERLAIQLEADHLRVLYDATYSDKLHGSPASPSVEVFARDLAFQAVFGYIIERFPAASYNRDELLERFALDYAMTPAQVKQVEEARYDYLVRKPAVEQTTGEKVVFAPVETVKNYLAVFQDLESRERVLSWIFGGELPDDRFLEGSAFGVNPDSEREVFWLMSSPERRAVLYNALLGEHGLFSVNMQDVYLTREKESFNKFLKSFYTNNFEAVLRGTTGDKGAGDVPDTMERALKIVFFEIFRQYSPPRRVELFLAITERMREVRLRGEQLTAGQAIRLFLEQIGVVGIKAGQVISEQKDMVSENIKTELSSLRDRTTPFSKFGVFTYLQLAGLMGERQPGESVAPFHIAQVGECLGSASIKQAHLAWTTEGKAIVVKVPRPTIDKNYVEDVTVLEKVFLQLRSQGIDVPEFLLKEITDACTTEFDFGLEGEAQRAVDANLYKRKAAIVCEENGKELEVTTKSIRLDVPNLVFLLRKGDSRVENLQLMIDEYLGGLTFKEIEEWQAFAQKTDLTVEQQLRKETLEQKLKQIYHERAALVGLEFRSISLESLRAQFALDLIEQIIHDGTFHADSHSGNIIVDLKPKAERIGMIDFGSVGHSIETDGERVIDHRGNFKDFLQNLMFLKMGLADTARLGAIVREYVAVDGTSAEQWSERIQAINGAQPEFGGFFKELLGEILAHRGQINRQFKLLLKSLASAGGNFDALSRYVQKAFIDAQSKALETGGSMGKILGQNPGFQKLMPLLEGNQQIRALLGI